MARYLSLCVSSTRPHHCPQGVNLGTELPQDSEVQMFEAALFSVLVGDVALPALSQNRSPKPHKAEQGLRRSKSGASTLAVALRQFERPP